MLPYVVESFSNEEAAILRRYFTNLDLPIFALVNLPEVVKGALFARYSRSAKSLRRLFLDEFVGELDISGDLGVDATIGLARAEELYERVFFEFGDDSVAQLGGVHLACEQSSNLLTKILEWGRLMAYLEQSTRYIAYDARLGNGQYRYYRPAAVLSSPLGARYVGDLDRLFDAYGSLLVPVTDHVASVNPRQQGDSDFVHRQAVKAKALDALRGLLPAASLSNVGIYGTGQAYEMLILRLRSHPLPEARQVGDLILTELRKVIPSFLTRVDLPDRGGVWSQYLDTTRRDTHAAVAALWPDLDSGGEAPAQVRLVDFDPEGEDKVLAAIAFSHLGVSETVALDRVRQLGAEQRRSLLLAYVGERTNRRHRPGRAFERTDYRFELVTDYGAFRDLQRHRMLTVEWQPLTSRLGYDLPDLVGEAGCEAPYREAMARSAELYGDMVADFPQESAYAVALGYRIRYVMQMNAREAMHLIELRSGPQGHPSYRRAAQDMHRLIAQQAGHRALAEAMSYVDFSERDLERLEAERRQETRRAKRVENSVPS